MYSARRKASLMSAALRTLTGLAGITLAGATLAGITLTGMAEAGDLAGQYAARHDGYDWSVTITPDSANSYKVVAQVSASEAHCLGQLDATGRLHDDRIVTDPPEEGDACTLTITRSSRGIRVRENDCLMWHGPACEFNADLARQ